jgi:hypothetical protein
MHIYKEKTYLVYPKPSFVGRLLVNISVIKKNKKNKNHTSGSRRVTSRASVAAAAAIEALSGPKKH